MEKKKSMFQATLSSIIFGIIVAMVIYFGLNFANYKEYRANARIIASSVEDTDTENLGHTFAKTIDSKAIKTRTLENLEIDWPISKLDSKMKITAMEGSKAIDISVTDTKKLRAEDLADEYADLAVTVINNIYNTGASVESYSYTLARPIDNSIRYASYGGLAGFVLYLLVSLVSVTRYNSKLEKKENKAYEKKEKKVKKQVEKNARAIEKQENKTSEPEKEDLAKTQGQRPLRESDLEEDLGETRKIDSEDIRKAKEDLEEKSQIKEDVEKKSKAKLEVLGKLPKYEIGALDV
uniref:hypothetical protein n=1 Tax=Anaerococcus mediterraneensis TaxID=1870984 RepID=UPI000932000C|nr:hypothetical protein [Anaerococcus mediterraneensis]